MKRYSSLAAGITALALPLVFSVPAQAHHGWSWADTEQMTLTGVVQKVVVAPPHPYLDVQTQNDGVWRVELGNPTQTRESGFNDQSAKAGQTIKAVGNRARDHAEKRMKAVQISVGGKTYDIYPERIGR
ncbi:hypothetical protein CAL12_25385 [Bordetella genomosp. 8]|uniref:DUF5666 domain-containing protein n=1 Tax=Bordetella genomosp. 8 TaxID=1416806 RepID=A0A1W6YS41_9BORD|nr:DUF6152 family protein [Bordetella genomosp. 8]ARP83814.1 hypothetical protein CAL12_25385 [Bordetella genomosp. 8]